MTDRENNIVVAYYPMSDSVHIFEYKTNAEMNAGFYQKRHYGEMSSQKSDAKNFTDMKLAKKYAAELSKKYKDSRITFTRMYIKNENTIMKKQDLIQLIKECHSEILKESIITILSPKQVARYNEYLKQKYKIIMYNPSTKKVVATQMKPENPSFEKTFEGFIPIAAAKGMNLSVSTFLNT